MRPSCGDNPWAEFVPFLDYPGEIRCVIYDDLDRTHARSRLRFLPQERPVLELNHLLGDADLPIPEVYFAASQTHQLAPTHTSIDRDVDQCPVSLVVRFGESDHLVPVEERPPVSGHAAGRRGRTGWSGSSASERRPATCGEGSGSGDEPTMARCQPRSRRSTSSRSHRPATGQAGMHRIAAARTCRGRADRSPVSWARAADTATETPRPRPRAACQRFEDRPIDREVDLRRSAVGTARRRPCERMCAIERCRVGPRIELGTSPVASGCSP